MGMVYGPLFLMVGKYFRRSLTFAMAVVNTGVSLGALVMPIVIRAVLDEFSFPAGLLVIAGILGQVSVYQL